MCAYSEPAEEGQGLHPRREPAQAGQSGGSPLETGFGGRLNQTIDDLLKKQSRLSGLIDLLLEEEVEPEKLIKLLALHGQNASRIGRLLRDQKVLEGGESIDKLLELLGPALDELAAELGIEL